MECTETTTRRQSDCHTVLSRHKRAAANTRTVEVVVTVGDVLGVPVFACGSASTDVTHYLEEQQYPRFQTCNARSSRHGHGRQTLPSLAR